MIIGKKRLTLIIILIIAAILRFYNLMHDAPHFFNPDERNMANAISQFRLPSKVSLIPVCLISQISPKNDPGSSSGSNDPGSSATSNCNLNPHFFAYGQFPLYLAFVSDQVVKVPIGLISQINQIQPSTTNHQLITNFPSAILWIRFWSALSSTFTVLLVYLITNVMLNLFQHLMGIPKQVRDDKNIIGNWELGIGHYAALIAAFTPALIQSAHFGTTESLLTFFFLASVYFSLKLFTHPLSLRSRPRVGRSNLYSKLSKIAAVAPLPRNDIVFISLVIGLALGSKLTGIFFFIPPLIAIMIRIILVIQAKRNNWISVSLFHCFIVSLLIIGSIFFFIISSPYNLINPQDFKGAVFGYEGDVATGKYEAFYTRQFVNTTPILFQLEKIFPYALGWPVFVLGTLGFFIITLQLTLKFIYLLSVKIKNLKLTRMVIPNNVMLNLFQHPLKTLKQVQGDNKSVQHDKIIILHFAFLIYLIPNSYLFAKWTRFMTPILPFFSIFAGYLLFVILGSTSDSRINSQTKLHDSGQARMTLKLVYLFIGLLVFISLLPGAAFMSIYAHEDSRVTASKWIYNNIPNNSYILSETANVVDIPLGLPNNVGLKDTPGVTASDAGSPGVEGTKTGNNLKTISFDFYHLDRNPILFEQLLDHLDKADYIFIPSRRIFVNYTRLSKNYPLVTKYYQLLFSGRLGFEKVAEISSFPSFTLNALRLTLPDEQAEETFTVFDHPVIRIYRKTKPSTKQEYKSLFVSETIKV